MPAKKKSVRGRRTKKAAVRKTSRKQDRLFCPECGREVVVSSWGVSDRSIYCCGRVMECR